METGEGQDTPSWYYDSDSDDSIVVTISQMQDEASKLQSTAAEIREELSGLLATLDDIELRATTEKRKKFAAKVKPESGDGICEEATMADPAVLKAVEEGKEPGDSDDRYRDVSTASAEPPRRGSRGDMVDTDAADAVAVAVAATVEDSKPFDPREILESIIDAVMERQTGAGDSLDAHPQDAAPAKDETQGPTKECPGAEGPRSVGDADTSTHSSDSDDHDVVVSGEPVWEGSGRRRRRPRQQRRGSDAGSSLGSVSSDAPSSSTTDDAYLLDEDIATGERAGGDVEGSYFMLD